MANLFGHEIEDGAHCHLDMACLFRVIVGAQELGHRVALCQRQGDNAGLMGLVGQILILDGA